MSLLPLETFLFFFFLPPPEADGSLRLPSEALLPALSLRLDRREPLDDCELADAYPDSPAPGLWYLYLLLAPPLGDSERGETIPAPHALPLRAYSSRWAFSR